MKHRTKIALMTAFSLGLIIGNEGVFAQSSTTTPGNSSTMNAKTTAVAASAEQIDQAQSMNPSAALDRLMQGNKRFVKDGTICPDRHQDRRTLTASKQRPFAVILGCSDSRVPPELAFDQGIGDIFVIRVAGNIVGDTERDSVEYSAIHNHSSIVLVLGHSNCGAVTAVQENNTKDIESIAKFIKPVIKPNQSLDQAIEANIRHSVSVLRKSAPIAKLIKEGKIDVVGGFYDLNTGEVRLLENLDSKMPNNLRKSAKR